MFNSFLEWRKKRGISPSKRGVYSSFLDLVIKHYIKPKWERHLLSVLGREKGVECLLFMNVPIDYMAGIPSAIKDRMKIPVVYYDSDMPTIPPKYAGKRGFKFNYYEDVDLSEFDAFLTNSKGCISDLEALGARNIHAFFYAIDPDLCALVNIEKSIDVFFFGYGSDFREQWMEKLITIPSREMIDVKFVVAGGNFKIDLGKARIIGNLSYSEWRKFCCCSRINLNITRWSHTNVYVSSTSRPFELAGFGACIVSQPYNGIEEWFEVEKELIVVKDENEAIETYRYLLHNKQQREAMGNWTRQRALKEHTFKHKARQLVRVLKEING